MTYSSPFSKDRVRAPSLLVHRHSNDTIKFLSSPDFILLMIAPAYFSDLEFLLSLPVLPFYSHPFSWSISERDSDLSGVANNSYEKLHISRKTMRTWYHCWNSSFWNRLSALLIQSYPVFSHLLSIKIQICNEKFKLGLFHKSLFSNYVTQCEGVEYGHIPK